MDIKHIIVILLAGLLVGLSKGGLGGPVPVTLTAPLLSLIMPVSEAVALILPLLMFADIFALHYYWREWDMHQIRLLLPTAVIGVAMGATLLSTLPDETMRPVLGIFTLLAVFYKLASDALASIRYESKNWHGYVAGWAAGFGASLANFGAPPFTAYMLLQRLSPTAFIGTATLFFATVNLLKIPAYLSASVIDAGKLVGIVWAFPVIPVGVWLGRYLIVRINPITFERMMMGLLILASVSLFVT